MDSENPIALQLRFPLIVDYIKWAEVRLYNYTKNSPLVQLL